MHHPAVVIVEDELIIAQDLAECLEEYGYDVAGIAHSFDSAIELIGAKQPDIVLIDIMIHGDKDGVEVAAWLRENHDIPFLFLTSHSDPPTVKRAVHTRPNGYLTKPFSQENVYVAIETALSHFQGEKAPGAEPAGYFIKNALFIRHKNMLVKLKLEEIDWLKAEGNYTEIWSDNKKYVVRNTLKEVEQRLPEHDFLRVHKSYVVRLEAITAINQQKVIVGGIEIPINKLIHDKLIGHINLLGH